jgi:hypothetical protein
MTTASRRCTSIFNKTHTNSQRTLHALLTTGGLKNTVQLSDEMHPPAPLCPPWLWSCTCSTVNQTEHTTHLHAPGVRSTGIALSQPQHHCNAMSTFLYSTWCSVHNHGRAKWPACQPGRPPTTLPAWLTSQNTPPAWHAACHAARYAASLARPRPQSAWCAANHAARLARFPPRCQPGALVYSMCSLSRMHLCEPLCPVARCSQHCHSSQHVQHRPGI